MCDTQLLYGALLANQIARTALQPLLLVAEENSCAVARFCHVLFCTRARSASGRSAP
jgi:hypothetical protein